MGPQAYNQFPQNSLRPKTTINKPTIALRSNQVDLKQLANSSIRIERFCKKYQIARENKLLDKHNTNIDQDDKNTEERRTSYLKKIRKAEYRKRSIF